LIKKIYNLVSLYGSCLFFQGLDLRLQHFHSFSHHGEGGHYHIDTEPDSVEYVGYFAVAEYIYRIDQPTDTHLFGRD